MLKSFANSDYDGNGSKDTFGLTMTGSTKRCDWIFDPAFGIGLTWEKSSSGYSHKFISPKQKEKLAFYKKLYDDGILDPEFITDKWDVMEDKYYSGKVGMICGSIGIVLNIYQGKMDNVQGKHTPIIALKPPADAFAPINSTLFLLRIPFLSIEIAVFNAVCPPIVGSIAHGFSFLIIFSTISGVIGSM